MSSALNQALAELAKVDPWTAPLDHAKAVSRALEALAREHQALGAIVERQDHRLITLETWSSAQTVEEPLRPRALPTACAGCSQWTEHMEAAQRELTTAKEHAAERLASLNAERDLKEQAQRQLRDAVERAEKVQRERDTLATDALAALSAAGIATPAEGYVRAPHCLASNIETLAKERDEALQQQKLAQEQARQAERDLAEEVKGGQAVRAALNIGSGEDLVACVRDLRASLEEVTEDDRAAREGLAKVEAMLSPAEDQTLVQCVAELVRDRGALKQQLAEAQGKVGRAREALR